MFEKPDYISILTILSSFILYSSPTIVKANLNSILFPNDCNGIRACNIVNNGKGRDKIHLRFGFGPGEPGQK